MRVPVAGAAVAAALLVLVPQGAAACTLDVSTPVYACTGGPCSLSEIRAMEREDRQREAIRYGREMTYALAARDASPATDRLFDLTRILMPAIHAPISPSNGCGGETSGERSGGPAIGIDDFLASVRERYDLTERLPLRRHVEQLVVMRGACNDEVRRGLAAYLRQVMTADEIAELWDFLVPRAGAVVPADGADPIHGGALVVRTGSGIAVDATDWRPHVEARKERAADYLAHHDNGIKLLSAVRQYWALRVAPLIDRPAELCPAADAAMVAFADSIRGQ